MRDLESVIKTLAEAAQLRDELLEALPEFPAERQLEARRLIHQLQTTLHTLGFAVAVAVQDEPPSPGPPFRYGPPQEA